MKKVLAWVLTLVLTLGLANPAVATETELWETTYFDFYIPTELTRKSRTEDYVYCFASDDGHLRLEITTGSYDGDGYLDDLRQNGRDVDRQVLFNLAYSYLDNAGTASTIANQSIVTPGMSWGGNYTWAAYTNGFMLASFYAGNNIGLLVFYCTDAQNRPTMEAAEMVAYMEKILLSIQWRGESAASAEEATEEEMSPSSAPTQYVVITNSSANIRTGPGVEYEKLITAKQGDTFPLLGQEDNWYIIDVNGQRGYVTNGLSKIK